MENEYLKKFQRTALNPYNYISLNQDTREKLVVKYAWAVPNASALKKLIEFSPIVEIGAGTGYWAALANSMGANVVPFDCAPPDREHNHWRHNKTYTKIYKGGPDTLRLFSKKFNLFLCWPPYDDGMAGECLKNFKGSFLIYIGEGQGGCTGDDFFHNLLSKNWEEKEEIKTPQYSGMHDCMRIFARK